VIDAPDRLVVDAAAGRLQRVPAGIDAVQADATGVPLRYGTVDAVLIVDGLHHLPDTAMVLEEAQRLLGPGAVLVVREFDRGTLRGRLLATLEHLVGMRSRFYTAEELAKRFEAAGLEATVIDRGVACTVVGVKPGAP
jgi:demethylmenaquinone methyltransferase/2-methoxy-6-polyprenyl-1,4-benzoquinol methylase